MPSTDLSCRSCSRPMVRVAKSLPQGLARCQPCRRGERERAPEVARPPGKVRPCSRCGDLRPVGRSSRIELICLPCRRRAYGLGPDQLVRDAAAAGLFGRQRLRGDCHRCGLLVPEGSRRWKYCSDECFRKARNARGSGAAKSSGLRGYGTEHQRLRAQLLPLAHGKPCHLCGVVMREGDDLHLDHTEDRSGYRGMSHAACNVLDGAKRGGERARQKRLREGWRPGQDPSTRRRPSGVAA